MIQNTLIVNNGVDTSDATATVSDVLNGKTFYANGVKVTGNIPTKTESNLTSSGATVTVPAGYYPSQVSKSVATATQATPSISVSTAGLITASATQSAGYVSSGTKSATKQLTTQAAQTITPGTSNKTIASGRYLTGTQTIKGDSNLVASNIKSGVSIFGVSGTLSSQQTVNFKANNQTSAILRVIVPQETGGVVQRIENGDVYDYSVHKHEFVVIYSDESSIYELQTSGLTLIYSKSVGKSYVMEVYEVTGNSAICILVDV